MCKINTLYSPQELKSLGPKKKKELQKHAERHVRNSAEIHKIIGENAKVKRIMRTEPHSKFRTAMRKKLLTTFNKLKG